MFDHLFILKPNIWQGEGIISLNMVEEELSFLTKWDVNKRDEIGKIYATQEIQIAGISENMKNELIFYDFNEMDFLVEMENANIGKVIGKGVWNEDYIAWEFRNNELNFEGFEIYHYDIKNNLYKMHSEYVTSDQFRTQIDGKIIVKQ